MELVGGHTYVLGAMAHAQGVNFALAAPHARRVELCLFSHDGRHETARLTMPGFDGGIWHGFLPGALIGQVYGFRVHGPWAPHQGHRFNPDKLLLDPCAREVVGQYLGQDIHLGHRPDDAGQPDGRDNAAVALKARVVADLPPTSPGVHVNPAQRVIYELHLKGYTALHPMVPPHVRGTYAGLACPAVIDHIKALGVTTLSIMPVAQRADEQRLLKMGLSNYWGYSPIAWNAPESRYWSGEPGTSPRSELRAMVDALHGAGLEVVLDVVYNHTGETDEEGPTLSMRGVDNAMYYHLDPAQPQRYMNWTGCGNCVNLNHPLVLRTVMDSLRGWVTEFGVDGFRFDLATALARGGADAEFAYSQRSAFLQAIAQDPLLRHVVLIAEPWDIGPHGYQLGGFPPTWLEWNDRFRDVQRGYWLHRCEERSALAQRLAGSSDCFRAPMRAAHSSINYITAHDGFTLNDLLSYAQRHNAANGEDNRDGHGHNLSINLGVEGPTDDAAIVAKRAHFARTLLACTLCALGTPMLLAGDEMGHTQNGNNNAYCQDNPGTWLQWHEVDHDRVHFVARLTALRRQRRLLQSAHWWRGTGEADDLVQARWSRADGTPMQSDEWHDRGPGTLQLQLDGGAMASGLDVAADTAGPSDMAHGDAAQWASCLLLINAGDQPAAFVLPSGPWMRHVDSASAHQCDALLSAHVTVPSATVWVATRARFDVAGTQQAS